MDAATLYMICGGLFTLSALALLAALARLNTMLRESRTRVVPLGLALMLEHAEISRMEGR
jgi:hypothetical protein